jgi:hypothetical protein
MLDQHAQHFESFWTQLAHRPGTFHGAVVEVEREIGEAIRRARR